VLLMLVALEQKPDGHHRQLAVLVGLVALPHASCANGVVVALLPVHLYNQTKQQLSTDHT